MCVFVRASVRVSVFVCALFEELQSHGLEAFTRIRQRNLINFLSLSTNNIGPQRRLFISKAAIDNRMG